MSFGMLLSGLDLNEVYVHYAENITRCDCVNVQSIMFVTKNHVATEGCGFRSDTDYGLKFTRTGSGNKK